MSQHFLAWTVHIIQAPFSCESQRLLALAVYGCPWQRWVKLNAVRDIAESLSGTAQSQLSCLYNITSTEYQQCYIYKKTKRWFKAALGQRCALSGTIYSLKWTQYTFMKNQKIVNVCEIVKNVIRFVLGMEWWNRNWSFKNSWHCTFNSRWSQSSMGRRKCVC